MSYLCAKFFSLQNLYIFFFFLKEGYWVVFSPQVAKMLHCKIVNDTLSNKNWVTVRDKCPQINVKFKWHTFIKKTFFWNGRTNERTHERTDGRTDSPILLCPKFYLGAYKLNTAQAAARERSIKPKLQCSLFHCMVNIRNTCSISPELICM